MSGCHATRKEAMAFLELEDVWIWIQLFLLLHAATVPRCDPESARCAASCKDGTLFRFSFSTCHWVSYGYVFRNQPESTVWSDTRSRVVGRTQRPDPVCPHVGKCPVRDGQLAYIYIYIGAWKWPLDYDNLSLLPIRRLGHKHSPCLECRNLCTAT